MAGDRETALMSEGGPTPEVESVFDDDDDGSTSGAIRITSVAALGGLLFGYETAVINGATKAIEQDFNVSSGALGFAVASALIGAAAGYLTAGRIADRIGRLKVMKIAAVLFFISAIGCAFAPSTGAAAVWPYLSSSESLVVRRRRRLGDRAGLHRRDPPARIRGRLGSAAATGDRPGIFLSFLVNLALRNAAEDGANSPLWLGLDAWRWMFPHDGHSRDRLRCARQHHSGIAALPDLKQRIPEARAVLEKLLGEKNLEITINRIPQQHVGEHKPSWRDLKRPTGGVYPIVWVGMLLSVFQQAVGINVIFYYSNVLWGRRLRREPGVLDVDDHLGDQHRDDDRRDPADRPRRSQAVAVGRVDRHGGDAVGGRRLLQPADQ